LPGISGDLEGSQEFLERMNLSYGIKFTDMEDEEKDLLKDALMDINPEIFGDCYTVPKETPLLRDLEEYSYILDACGKNKKQGLGLSIALGERDQALDAALRLQRQYRDQIVKGLEWIKREGAEQLNTIQYLYSEDKVLKSVMGTIASIGLSVKLLDSAKPVIGMSRLHKDIKISGRTTRDMVAKGVNLGKALRDSSNNFMGTGGGHDIAAGAMIPYEAKDQFLHLVDEMVEYQLNQ
jgi:RecJ-like exonuclease